MRIVLFALLLGACGATAKPPAAPEVPAVEALTPEDAPIAFRRSIVADQYFWLRAKVLEGEAPPPFRDALAAMLDLREDLAADPTAWEDLEVPLGSLGRARELEGAYAQLPASRVVGTRTVPLRAHGVRLAKAMADAEADFRAGPYREHGDEIARAAKELSALLLPGMESILHAIEADMALPGSARRLVVTLVADAPYQGAFAADEDGRETASFVRVRGLSGSVLVETVLLELLHAIDELTVRSPTAMNMLRAALARRGLSDEDVEMVVTTVSFAEAASLVRRFVNPSHRAVGETGIYTLYAPAPAIVAAWDRHIADGESIDDTTEAIVKAVSAREDP